MQPHHRFSLKSTHRPAPLLLEAQKLIPTPLPQPLQHHAHLLQLVLQLLTGVLGRLLVQLLIDVPLKLARPGRGVLAHRLGHELDVQGRLHEGRQRIPVRLPKRREEGLGHLLQQVREHLIGQRTAGGRGGDLRVGVHEPEEGVVDVRADLAGPGGGDGGGSEAGVDDGRESGGDWGGVGEEEAVGDLGEGFADLGALVGEGDGEVGFELGDEGGDGF